MRFVEEILFEKRKDVLFPLEGGLFAKNCDKARKELAELIASDKENKEVYVKTAAELAVDLKSYLPEWKLRGFIEDGTLAASDIDKEAEAFFEFASASGGDKYVEEAKKEIEAINNSSIKKMCEMQLENKLNTVWGHDYASGLTHSLRRGARWVTSNPAKITGYKADFPDRFEAIVSEIKQENPGVSLDDAVSLVFTKICAISARELRPIFEATNGEYGFVCMQTNPHNIAPENSSDAMINQVEFWYESMKKELGVDTPNVVFKLPAAESGVRATEVLADRGYRLCITLNFTVTQHEIFAELISKGKKNGYVVLMGGLLDDKVAADLKELGIENAVEYGRYAAQAVIRKSYAMLKAKGYDDKASIMTAAVRGPWAIANSLAPAGGAPILVTTVTGKINEFDAAPLPLQSAIDQPLPEDIMDILNKSKVFRQAYATKDEGLLGWDDLYEYPPFVAFYDQFRDAYTKVEEYVKSVGIG
ncbi:MAG: transaldolase family protein [Christensenellales bacterium]|jgi:transaldolase